MAIRASQDFNHPLIINFHSLGIVRFQMQQKYAQNLNEEKTFKEIIIIEKEAIEEAF